MTIGDTQNSHVKKTCHGPSHGPRGIHRSRRVPWDTFQRGNVDCYEIDYSLVPFTMRTTKLHVIEKNRQNARRSCTELSFYPGEGICLYSLAVDSRGNSVQNGAFR